MAAYEQAYLVRHTTQSLAMDVSANCVAQLTLIVIVMALLHE
jgi:hypothetical protein